MNKSESKYYNTACLMNQALLLLLEKKDFEYISVKEICEKAGVNRSTFYLHYDKMEDLLAETIKYLYTKLKDKFVNIIKLNKETIENATLDELMLFKMKYAIPYLEFIKANKKTFISIIKYPNLFQVDQTFMEMFNSIFKPIQSRFNIPNEEKLYIMKFYISGIHAIIIEWIKNDCKDDINFIANLIEKCILTR